MDLLAQHISGGAAALLVLAIGLALTFEFVNGFHDTANAVATVIYTHSLKPTQAVVWSGLWNLIGVLVSSGAVAFGITALLPVELILTVGSAAGFAMVFALLLSAIVWNLGTWYLGLPASSSHTLIGSIMGVGLANSVLAKGHVFGEGVNWEKTKEVGISLLVSPVVGFVFAALLLLLARSVIRRDDLFSPPDPNRPPPLWIRLVLIVTCTGVSFAHGSNDGQKGMGLIMLILVGIIPGAYALNLGTTQTEIQQIVGAARIANDALRSPATLSSDQNISRQEAEAALSSFLKTKDAGTDTPLIALNSVNSLIADRLEGKASLADLSPTDRQSLRIDIYLASHVIFKLNDGGLLNDVSHKQAVINYAASLDRITEFIPAWVKLSVALALGIGTMIGWKRIVITVGERIGKQHLTYAQGACAELVAMTTIGVADTFGLPVSTTHVLSSGVAGTMVANRSGLQMNTLRNIALAWLLTLPVSVFLGAALFALSLNIVLRFGLHSLISPT